MFFSQDCSDEIYKKARSVLETLREFGATVDEVNIAELYENLVAHRLIILSEMLHSSRQHLAEEPSVLVTFCSSRSELGSFFNFMRNELLLLA